jgi:hypothetical protein
MPVSVFTVNKELSSPKPADSPLLSISVRCVAVLTPGQHCLAVYDSGKWDDTTCTSFATKFVCQTVLTDDEMRGVSEHLIGLDALCDVTGAESPPRPELCLELCVREWHEHPGGWSSA